MIETQFTGSSLRLADGSLLVEIREGRGVFEEHARHRAGRKAQAGVQNQQVDMNVSRKRMDLQGLLGEAAMSIVLGLPVVSGDHLGGDAGHDFDFEGWLIEAKYTPHVNGGLLVKPGADGWHLGFLCTATPRRRQRVVTVRAFVTQPVFAEECEPKTWRGQAEPWNYLHQSKLWPATEFCDIWLGGAPCRY